jgi:broad specificity phosphatase PhoE
VNGDPSVPCPLSVRGREEALALGRALRDEQIDLCVTSEFGRTHETADLALTGRHVPRFVLSDLNDPNYGSFEGGLLDDYRAWARAHRSDEAPPGGETREQIVARYACGYEAVLARPEETILVVAHSLPVAYVLGGGDIAPVVPLVGHAEPHRLSAPELARRVERMRAWLADPTW